MVLFNYSTRELTTKIVYYGPGLCGKTTNLQFIHKNLPEPVKGKMLSLATKTDRTLFFDFLPMDLGEIRGMKTRLQLYTVPGQVFYNETRKLVLKGVDGIVFVADSQQEMLGANVESFRNLDDNLKTHGLSLAEIPHVIQFNKRDLPKLSPIEELNAAINKHNAPFYESVATTGIGVNDTLKAITKLVLLNLTKRYEPRTTPAAASVATPAAVAAPAAVARAAAGSSNAPTPVAVENQAAAPARAAAAGRKAKPTAKAAGPAPSAPVRTAPEPTEDDVDLLVEEIQGYRSPAAIDAPLPPETPTAGSAPDLGAPAEGRAAQAAVDDLAIQLTEAVTDRELFDEPGLAVSRLAHGQSQEILIPVELGDVAGGLRRFKLSLTLKLEPVD